MLEKRDILGSGVWIVVINIWFPVRDDLLVFLILGMSPWILFIGYLYWAGC